MTIELWFLGIYIVGYIVSLLAFARLVPRLRTGNEDKQNERMAIGFFPLFWPLAAIFGIYIGTFWCIGMIALVVTGGDDS